MFHRILFCALSLCAFLRTEETSTPSVRFRAQTFALESAQITNPIAWVLMEDRMQEGSLVKKGDVVFQLSLEETQRQIDSLEARIAEARNRVARDGADMEQNLQNLKDRKESLEDDRSIQQARLNFLRSLPREEDISIAKGRLAVAEKELTAEREHLNKQKQRLEKHLISPSQVEQAERSYSLQEARTRYAEEMMRIAQKPATPEEIRITELRIQNLDLEIGKLAEEIPNQRKILGIRQDRRTRYVRKLEEELAERKEELQYGELRAPANGVLLYTNQFKRQLATGSKPSKGMVIGEIPVQESLALKGAIPEQTRHLFEPGDEAVVELNTHPGQTFRARLSNISPFSQDVLDDAETSSGVKRVEVELQLIDPPADLKFGVYGWVTLISGRDWDTPRVPVSWVRMKSGKPHLSVSGVYQAVEGLVEGDTFILGSPHPAVNTIQSEGTWADASTNLMDAGNLYTLSGELLPLEKIDVTAPRIRAWDLKISWLAPDNTQIEKGEVIARLDSQMLTDQLRNQEERLETRIGDREAVEQELEITQSQGSFQLVSATNQLEIARLNQSLALSRKDESRIAQTRMNRITARIQLEAAQSDLEKAERTPELVARAELERRQRDVAQKTLLLERAKLNAEVAAIGSSALERSRAELEVARTEANLANQEARYRRDMSRLKTRLQRRTQREQRDRNRLESLQKQADGLVLTAPASGLIQYEKIWDGVRRSKVRSGLRIWPNTTIISLSNTTRVYVEVPVPERYIHELEIGMHVQIVIPSEGNRQWQGEVTHIGQILEPIRLDAPAGSLYANQESTQQQILPIRVVVDSTPESALKPGAIAQLIFPFDR